MGIGNGIAYYLSYADTAYDYWKSLVHFCNFRMFLGGKNEIIFSNLINSELSQKSDRPLSLI